MGTKKHEKNATQVTATYPNIRIEKSEVFSKWQKVECFKKNGLKSLEFDFYQPAKQLSDNLCATERSFP